MNFLNAKRIKGIFPHKGEQCFKYTDVFGETHWKPVKKHKPAQCYNDSYLTVSASSVHPDDLPLANITNSGYARLFVGMRLIGPYKVSVHDGAGSYVFTIKPTPENPVVIEKINYGNAHAAHTVWYTDGTEPHSNKKGRN